MQQHCLLSTNLSPPSKAEQKLAQHNGLALSPVISEPKLACRLNACIANERRQPPSHALCVFAFPVGDVQFYENNTLP